MPYSRLLLALLLSMAGVWLQLGEDLGDAWAERIESATDYTINLAIFMQFLLSKGEILSLFVTYLAVYDFVSIIFCNFGAYFSKESTKTYLLKFSHRISTSNREINEHSHVTIGAVHGSAGFIHKLHGVVLNLTGDMAVVCAFSMSRG